MILILFTYASTLVGVLNEKYRELDTWRDQMQKLFAFHLLYPGISGNFCVSRAILELSYVDILLLICRVDTIVFN